MSCVLSVYCVLCYAETGLLTAVLDLDRRELLIHRSQHALLPSLCMPAIDALHDQLLSVLRDKDRGQDKGQGNTQLLLDSELSSRLRDRVLTHLESLCNVGLQRKTWHLMQQQSQSEVLLQTPVRSRSPVPSGGAAGILYDFDIDQDDEPEKEDNEEGEGEERETETESSQQQRTGTTGIAMAAEDKDDEEDDQEDEEDDEEQESRAAAMQKFYLQFVENQAQASTQTSTSTVQSPPPPSSAVIESNGSSSGHAVRQPRSTGYDLRSLLKSSLKSALPLASYSPFCSQWRVVKPQDFDASMQNDFMQRFIVTQVRTYYSYVYMMCV